MTRDLPGAVPELPVSDLAAATAYYRDRLGFTIDWIEEAIDLAGISQGRCRLFLAGPGFRESPAAPEPVTIWLNLDGTDQVDALYRAWHAAGAPLPAAPETKPWGLHEFTAVDPDGNRCRVFYDVATPTREGAAGAGS